RLDEGCRFLFRRAANLTDHDDGFGFRILLEHGQDVGEVGTRNRVATDTHTGGLAKAVIRGLLHRLIGQCARAGHDADPAWLMDVARHDADLALTWRDHAWAVRPDQTYAQLVTLDLHVQHVECRNAFGDTDDQLDTSECRFQDRILTEGSRHIDDRGIGARGF